MVPSRHTANGKIEDFLFISFYTIHIKTNKTPFPMKLANEIYIH